MGYISVKEFAERWSLSERTVRDYCAKNRIEGVFLTGKTWNIPLTALPPKGKRAKVITPLLDILKEQKDMKLKGGIYHRTQIDLTYNSNHIEGSCLTIEQTRYIYETKSIGVSDMAINVDDIIETSNHFRAIDYCIDNGLVALSEAMIKQMHYILKSSTSDGGKEWFKVGEYKKLPNEVGGNKTTAPEEVKAEMQQLIKEYNSLKEKTLEDIVAFHHKFESIHPFQDGNGRVGRLIMFKECLANNHVPIIIDEKIKMFYYRGLQNWPKVKESLMDTCLSAQDSYKAILDYFKIGY